MASVDLRGYIVLSTNFTEHQKYFKTFIHTTALVQLYV